MFKFAVVLAVIAVAAASPIPESYGPIVPMLDGRIVGGVAVDIKDYPYQLSLQYDGRHICGASIISKDWVLTAAHCISGFPASGFSVRAGSTTNNAGGSIHAAESTIVHSQYDFRTIDYDLAVIKVKTPFNLGTVPAAIPLPSAGSNPSEGALAYVSGWGKTSSSGSAPTGLRAVDVPIVSQAKCKQAYGSSAITDRMVCAGVDEGGKDSCQGDSGGPLVVNKVLVGVFSWGRGCAQAEYPGVYANVGNMRDWIKSKSGV